MMTTVLGVGTPDANVHSSTLPLLSRLFGVGHLEDSVQGGTVRARELLEKVVDVVKHGCFRRQDAFVE
jgi:hypothetical protein